jgi:predicted SAM-dependent methyltransferase
MRVDRVSMNMQTSTVLPQHIAQSTHTTPVMRLNWGCGLVRLPGWINSDQHAAPGVDVVADIRHGLPIPSGSLDYIVSIHSLPEIPFLDLPGVLWEMKRMLKPNGVIRLALPDLDRAIRAYQNNDRSYFLIPDEHVQSIGGKLVTQLIWYGQSKMLFTYDFIAEFLSRIGFRDICACAFRETANRYPEIVELDNREPESLFVEAVK